jgi:ABC-type multidrug transport system permease subunit
MMKEWIEIYNDKHSLFFILAVPVVQIILYGYGVSYDVRNVETVVFDQDHRVQSQRILDQLLATNYFHLGKQVHSRQAVDEAIIAGRAKVGIIFPPDLSANIQSGEPAQVQILIDGSDATVANALQAAVVAIGLDQSVKMLNTVAEEKAPPLPLEMRTRMLFNPDVRTTNFILPGVVAYMAQMLTMFVTILSVVREREAGTLEQISVTPVTALGLMLGKLIPYLIISFIGTNLLLAAMYFLFHVPIHGNLLVLELCMALFIFVSLTAGLLISASSQNLAQATQAAMFTIVPTVLLSGFIFPRETMPLPLQWLGLIIPLTYFLQIQRGIILRGAGLQDLWIWLVPLSLMGLAMLYLSIKKFKAIFA